MSTSIILLDQNFNANDVCIMVFEPYVLFSPLWPLGGGGLNTWSFPCQSTLSLYAMKCSLLEMWKLLRVARYSDFDLFSKIGTILNPSHIITFSSPMFSIVLLKQFRVEIFRCSTGLLFSIH